MEQLPIVVLWGCLYMGVSHIDCVCLMPLVGGLDLMWLQVTVFPQGVQEAIAVVGGGAGDGGARGGVWYEAGFPLCSVAIIILSGIWIKSQDTEMEALRI